MSGQSLRLYWKTKLVSVGKPFSADLCITIAAWRLIETEFRLQMSWISFMSVQNLFVAFCEPCFCYKRRRRGGCSAQGPNQSHLTPLFFLWVSMVCVAKSTQQIAVGPNKRCTVEPCGSTDTFYTSHKEQLWKIQDLFTPTGENVACRIGFQAVSVEAWFELGFICILKDIIILF